LKCNFLTFEGTLWRYVRASMTLTGYLQFNKQHTIWRSLCLAYHVFIPLLVPYRLLPSSKFTFCWTKGKIVYIKIYH